MRVAGSPVKLKPITVVLAAIFTVLFFIGITVAGVHGIRTHSPEISTKIVSQKMLDSRNKVSEKMLDSKNIVSQKMLDSRNKVSEKVDDSVNMIKGSRYMNMIQEAGQAVIDKVGNYSEHIRNKYDLDGVYNNGSKLANEYKESLKQNFGDLHKAAKDFSKDILPKDVI